MARKDPDIVEQLTVSVNLGKRGVDSFKERINEILTKNKIARIVVCDEKGGSLLDSWSGNFFNPATDEFAISLMIGVITKAKGSYTSVEFRKK